MALKTVIQLKHDTALNWETLNPTLKAGEYGFDSTHNKLKVGDGIKSWTALPYLNVDIAEVKDLAEAIATAKSEAIETAATDATTKANAAEENAKKYADGLSVNYDAVGAAATAKTEAKAYTDALSVAADGKFELQISAAAKLTEAKAYTDDLANEFEDYKNEVGLSAASSTNHVATMEDIRDIAGAMHFIGVTTEEMEDGQETLPTDLYPDGKTAEKGDFVIDSKGDEFVWTGSKWTRLGAEGIYETKADAAAKLVEAKAYADSLSVNYDAVGAAAAAKAEAIAEAKTYTDTEITKLSIDTTYETKADAAAKLVEAKAYTDEVSAATLQSAKDYTDEELEKLADTVVTDVKVNGKSVVADNVADINLGKLAFKDMVETGDIVDGVVTTAKLADGAVTQAKMTGPFEFDCGDANGNIS